jgi:hypothetical protein
LTQTLGKTDQSYERKWRKKRKNENHSFKKKSQRIRGGFGLLFPLQISVQTPLKIQQIFYLSRELEEANPKIKRGNKSGERGEGDGGSLILFNRAITQSQFVPGYN